MPINVNGTEMQSIIVDGVEMKKVIVDGVTVYEKAPVPTVNNYLTFTGENGNDFTLSANKTWDGTMWTSTDAQAWTEWDGSAVSSANGVLYLKGKNEYCATSSGGMQCVLSANAGCSGNCMTLLNCDNPDDASLNTMCFSDMFRGCTGLTSAPELPATTLADYCYASMFRECRGLTSAPELPATTLADSCYNYMFYGCRNIKISTTQDSTYRTPYRIPTTGTGTTSTDSLSRMFDSTGGAFTGTPTINTTYYGDWD